MLNIEMQNVQLAQPSEAESYTCFRPSSKNVTSDFRADGTPAQDKEAKSSFTHNIFHALRRFGECQENQPSPFMLLPCPAQVGGCKLQELRNDPKFWNGLL